METDKIFGDIDYFIKAIDTIIMDAFVQAIKVDELD